MRLNRPEYQVRAMIDAIHLSRNGHRTRDDGVCALEAAAWLAGEEHGDQPECVSPILGALIRALNDNLVEDDRQALKRYLLPILGTGLRGVGSDGIFEQHRTVAAVDWAVRTAVPEVLFTLGWNGAALRNLPPLLEQVDWEPARLQIEQVHDAVRSKADILEGGGLLAGHQRAAVLTMANIAIREAADALLSLRPFTSEDIREMDGTERAYFIQDCADTALMVADCAVATRRLQTTVQPEFAYLDVCAVIARMLAAIPAPKLVFA